MAYLRKYRPGLENQQRRPGTIFEISVLFAVAFAAFSGVLALLFAHCLRDVRLERQSATPSAELTVDYRFQGVKFWRGHWPSIVQVEGRTVHVPRDSDGPFKIDDVVTHTVFQDDHQHEALILRDSSLHGHVEEMQKWLASGGLSDIGVLTIHEETRWWSSSPIQNMIWCWIGLVIGAALGAFFLIGAVSAVWVRMTWKKR